MYHSLTDDLDQHTLSTTTIKLAVKYLFPRKVQPAISDSYDNFPPHHLSLQVGVAVVLAGAGVAVAADGREEGSLGRGVQEPDEPHYSVQQVCVQRACADSPHVGVALRRKVTSLDYD